MTARRALRTSVFLPACAALVLAACQPPAEDTDAAGADQVAETRQAIVTSAFEASARAEELVFLPNAEAPWTGLIAASLTNGGFDIFNVDGETVISAAGPRLRGLAGVPEFALRGESFPLLFGADEDGQLRGFAVVRETRDVIELPLEGAPDGAAGLCLFDEGIGYVELALLGEDAQARLVRIRDTGGAGLTVELRQERALPFPARSCAGAEDDLLVAGPTAGLARVDALGAAQAFAPDLSVSDVAFTELLGRPVALVASSQTGLLTVYDARSLDPIVDVQFEDGLSAPSFERPSAIAMTDANYGGMGFSTGLMAAYDDGDSRVKLVAREVISRTVVGGE